MDDKKRLWAPDDVEFAHIKIGDLVQIRYPQVSKDWDPSTGDDVDGEVNAETGDLCWVVAVERGSCPTLRHDATGIVFDADPTQFHVLAGEGFASTPETTPKKPVRYYIRRGQT